jgi:hypothetical protein
MTSTWKVPAVIAAGLLVGCGGPARPPTGPASPSPTPSPDIQEVPGIGRGTSEGVTTIWLTSADPLPGATVAGCGRGASGCAGRIRMTFRLVSPSGGPTLGLLAYLHSDRVVACFVGRVGSLVLAPEGQDVDVVFDPADTDEVCPTPLDITHLAVVVEGTGSVYGRQEWATSYHLVR